MRNELNELRKSVYLDRLQSMAVFQGVAVDDLDHLSTSQAWDDACSVVPWEEWEEWEEWEDED